MSRSNKLKKEQNQPELSEFLKECIECKEVDSSKEAGKETKNIEKEEGHQATPKTRQKRKRQKSNNPKKQTCNKQLSPDLVSPPSKKISTIPTMEPLDTSVPSDTQKMDSSQEFNDDTPLSPELLKLEKRMNRSLTKSLTQALQPLQTSINGLITATDKIAVQQTQIDHLQAENTNLKRQLKKLESTTHVLQEKMTRIENEALENNLVFFGVVENLSSREMIEERVEKLHCCIADTLDIEDPSKRIEEARKFNITKARRLRNYSGDRCRPITVQFKYKEDADAIFYSKKHLPKGVFVDRQYSNETERRRRRLRPILQAARRLSKYQGECRMEADVLVIKGIRYTMKNIDQLPEDLNTFKVSSVTSDEACVFFGELNPFSNFYPVGFYESGDYFSSSEQYIQYKKATYFKDFQAAAEIMTTDDPLECKKLAREINNYNEHRWNQVAYDICEPGVHAKFKQNIKLTNMLIMSGNKKLAEASRDDVWGTGFYLGHVNCADPNKWINQGILGQMLCKLRTELQTNNTNISHVMGTCGPSVSSRQGLTNCSSYNSYEYFLSLITGSTSMSMPTPTPIADRLRNIASTAESCKVHQTLQQPPSRKICASINILSYHILTSYVV